MPHRPRAVLISQARMGSSRLPGKSLMPLAGEPMVARILERLRRCQRVDEIVLATSDLERDDPLAELAQSAGVACFRGSESDVLDRYYRAAVEHDADVVVRVPADNPVPEPSVIDSTIEHHLAQGMDFTSTYPDVFDNGFPDGIGAEVISIGALTRAWEASTEPRNREHPHTFFYDHPELFKIGTMECPPEIRRPDIILDVNTIDQYQFLNRLYEDLYPSNPEFGIAEVIAWVDRAQVTPEKAVVRR